jgi:hypothetical protein
MNRNPHNGQFRPKPTKGHATSILDLPKTNREVVELYQTHNILPKFKDGKALEIKTFLTCKGDKINDHLTFYDSHTRSYPSVRPILAQQDKLPLLLSNHILYKLLLKTPHAAIAIELGWQYRNYNNDVRSKQQPITRIRSNQNSFHFVF